MLAKPAKYHLNPHHFHPISLFNIDIKLLAKVLATRLNVFLTSLIHKDEVGFVLNRQAPDNMCRVIYLMHPLDHNKLQGMLLSLDIHIALNTISWDYLHYILQK